VCKKDFDELNCCGHVCISNVSIGTLEMVVT